MTTQTKPQPIQLTPKQEAFCIHYFAIQNATQAAIKAGYSPDTARQIGQDNLTKVDIQARLHQLADRRPSAEAAIASVTERLELLSKLARHEIEMPVSASHVIQAISEHNKMEHIYETDTKNIYQDIKVLVVREKPRQLPEPSQDSTKSISSPVMSEVVEDVNQ